MINTKLSTKFSALALALLLAGCGGGGSEGYYENGNSGGNTGGSDNAGNPSEVQSLKITNFLLTDSNGAETQTISALGAIATVKVADGNGNPVRGALVTFSGENMTFSTTNSSVFTNADGEASIGVMPTDSNVTGAYKISASVELEDQTATQSKNVSFVKTDIVIDQLVAASTSLVSGGSTLITLITKDADGNYQNNQEVTFSAGCGSFSNPKVVSSSEGNISNTYYAYDAAGKLCSGNQKITVTPSTSPTNSKELSVNIQAATATSIVYTSTDELKIPVQGSGSSSSGQVEFTVYSNSTALANQDVTLSLNKAPRGSSFVSLGNTEDRTVKTDSNGKVIVNIYPGDIPGPVEIKATLPSGFSALAKNITITTGRATQNSFSLSVSKNSLENDKDGDTTTIVARLADRNGNDVPDGTVVNFITEGGKVDGACSTVKGQCSVELSTQNPRPADGRVSVLAYVEGDKSYVDTNGDNIYTPGVDTLVNNIGSFFRDDNENNRYDSGIGEFKYDRQLLGSRLTCGISSFSEPNITNTCDNQLSAILRQQIVLYFADSTATIRDLRASGSSLSFNLFGKSALTTPMPSGTTIAVTPEDITDNNKSCTAELSSGSNPIANVINSTYYQYRLKDCAAGDNFKITTTAPNGKVSNFYVTYR
ncbi:MULTISPECIES: Ig-like domain-containing protein [Acinetobacter]|uniref:Ig-like domain-containing protein n=1 Tax=Acinetobacter TaxID=469 RepID=UPI0005374E2E|nr:Ig-like domain-containing protein [Acinetobacter sp. HR7]KGT48555.1 hypothetical protein GW12_04070 [Acinetobacter sp. HR7]